MLALGVHLNTKGHELRDLYGLSHARIISNSPALCFSVFFAESQKEDRQISLTACLYREKPLASHECAIKALRATPTEREARNAEEE